MSDYDSLFILETGGYQRWRAAMRERPGKQKGPHIFKKPGKPPQPLGLSQSQGTSESINGEAIRPQHDDCRVRNAGPGQTHPAKVAGNSPVYSHGCKSALPVADGAAGKPGCRTSGRILYFRYSSQGCVGMTLYGYARVSVREPEDKNLDLQVERLVRAGCSMGNIRAEEASGAKDDRGGLLALLDLVVEGDTLVVTHIDRLSGGLTYGLQVIEGLHHAGVEFRSLSEDFDTATATATASSNSRWCSPSASGGGTRSGSALSRGRRRRGPRGVTLADGPA